MAIPARLKERGFLEELEKPIDVCQNLSPNWFAAVMGTGIVANSSAMLPLQFPGLRFAATVVWALASIMLIALIIGTVIHWKKYRPRARSHHLDPVMAQFYGAPPMAMMTVGLGTLTLGKDVIGLDAALAIDWVLWTVGTLLGLFVAVFVPFTMMTKHSMAADSAFGGWLMPLVSPMVSATTGAALIPFAPEGQFRLNMLLACYAMFGLSLIASCIVITLVWSRLIHYGTGPRRLTPTLFIVLGPLGQSITAANALALVAHLALPPQYASAFEAVGLIYGITAWGFAALWFTLCVCLTVRAARQGRNFAMTYWSFIFPIGTCVTGTIDLAERAGSVVLEAIAVGLWAVLIVAWLYVFTRTIKWAWPGTLFLSPPTPLPEMPV